MSFAKPISQYLPENKKDAVVKDERKAVREFYLWEVYRCSLTVVSNSCYALTSGHCIEPYLEQKKIGEYFPINDGQDTKFLLTDHLQMHGTKLPLTMAKKNIEGTLIAIGNGLGGKLRVNDWRPPNYDGGGLALSDYEEYNKFIKQSHYGTLADWALIKLPEENCSCLTTGSETPNGNVIMVGYPRNDIEVQILKKLFPKMDPPSSVAEGVVCMPDRSNQKQRINSLPFIQRILAKAITNYDIQMGEKVLKNTAETFKDELIFNTARSGNGASGGALLNSRFELIGINQGGFSFDDFVDPFAIAVNVEYIKKEIEKKISPEEFKEAFTCDPKK